MKRIFTALVILVVLIASGSYGVWHYASERMLKEIDALLTKEQALGLENITYKAEKYGFPTEVGLIVTDFSANLKESGTAGEILIKTEGETRYFVNVVDLFTKPGTFHTESRNNKIRIDFKAHEQSGAESGILRVDLGSVMGEIAVDHNAHMDISLEDLDLYAHFDGMEVEERLATLDHIKYRGTYTEDVFGLIHSDGRIEVSGATFIDPQEKNSTKLDTLIVDVAYANMPKKEIENVRQQLQITSKSGNAKPLKEALKALIKTMAEKKTMLSINTLQMKTEGLSLKSSGSFEVGARAVPRGGISVLVEADNKIKKLLPGDALEQLATTPFGQQLTGGTAKLEFSGRIDNGFIVMNGVPFVSVPPLTTLVDLMPNNLDMHSEADVPVPLGPQVAPEEPVDNLLEHFQNEVN